MMKIFWISTSFLIFSITGCAASASNPGAQSSTHASKIQLPDLAQEDQASIDILDASWSTSAGSGSVLTVKRALPAGACSKTSSCSNGACCSKDGWCGYSPTHCGAGCYSNCNAVAECGEFARPAGKRCPLNVCCSAWGFCGTTKAFCEVKAKDGCQSNCVTPKPQFRKTNTQQRIIGYYEAWNTDRKCNVMPLKSTPIEKLTHLYFAFAFFSPDTFKITAMPGVSIDKYKEAAGLKRRNPLLKVVLAIGGWSFNDPGPTQKLFSKMVSTKPNRALCIKNLLGFLSQYGYDGVDFDWEYPGADDRGGTKEDGPNFAIFLQELRAAARKSFPDLVVTITIPTSYWYLRHFPITKLVEQIDWINMMSYDIHGVWDQDSQLGPVVRHHAGLDEIDDGLALLWRSNIDPAKIVLGLAFYGRSFKLSDPKCSTVGCRFSGPGDPGPCTNTPGILSYKEIRDLLKLQGANSKYDAKAGSKYLTYGKNSWVSYDDDESFRKKIDFANARGLGGLMIWAIDLDNSRRDALHSISMIDSPLSDVQVYGLSLRSGYSSSISGSKTGCHITGCGEKCSYGFIAQTRLGHKDGSPNCPTNNFRYLCCPPWAGISYRDCQWNDGRGQGAVMSDCAGTCKNGQIMLARDSWGWEGDIQKGRAPNRCGRGGTAYCCNSLSLESSLKLCQVADCGKSCPKDTMQISSKLKSTGKICSRSTGFETADLIPQKRNEVSLLDNRDGNFANLCCPSSKFKNCGWKDGGRCSESCGVGQIQLKSEPNWKCYGSRERVLCCDSPKGTSEFLPFNMDNIFDPRYRPDRTLEPKYELRTFGRLVEETKDPSKLGVAFLVIVGDTYAVTSLRKRASQSYPLTFVDCPRKVLEAHDDQHQTARVVCLHEDLEACFAVTERGVEGTVIEMPDNCGAGSWARALSLAESQDQQLPSHMSGRNTSVIYDLTFDFNMRLIRRDAGPIALRMDYSNAPGYWNNAIYQKPLHRLSKRFYSDNPDKWETRFETLKMNPGDGNDMSRDFGQLIYFERRDSCPVPRESQKYPEGIAAAASGSIKAEVYYGFTMTATIDSGKLNIHNNNAFIRVRGQTDLNFEFNGIGEINAAKDSHGNPWIKQFPAKIQGGHSVFKGFASFEPYIQTGVWLGTTDENRSKSSVDFNGKITVRVQSNFADTTVSFPHSGEASSDRKFRESKRAPDRIGVKSDNVLYSGSHGSGTISLNFFTRMGLKTSLSLPQNLASSKPLPDISWEKQNIVNIKLMETNHKEARCVDYQVGTIEKALVTDTQDKNFKKSEEYINVWQTPDAGRCFPFSPFKKRSTDARGEIDSQAVGPPGWNFKDAGQVTVFSLLLREYINSQRGRLGFVPGRGVGNGNSNSGGGGGDDDNGNGNNDHGNGEDDRRLVGLDGPNSFRCSLFSGQGEDKDDFCCGCICMICRYGDGRVSALNIRIASNASAGADAEREAIGKGYKYIFLGGRQGRSLEYPQYPAWREKNENADKFLNSGNTRVAQIHRFFHEANDDCADWNVIQEDRPSTVTDETTGVQSEQSYHTEHILEAQTVSRFFKEYVRKGNLTTHGDVNPEDDTAVPFMDISLLDAIVQQEPAEEIFPNEPEHLRRPSNWIVQQLGMRNPALETILGQDEDTFVERLAHELGSLFLPRRLALLHSRANSMKGRILKGVMPVAWNRFLREGVLRPEVQLQLMKEFGMAFSYMNHPVIWEAFCATFEGIHRRLGEFDAVSVNLQDGRPIDERQTHLQEMWSRFMRYYLDRMTFRARKAFWKLYDARTTHEDYEPFWARVAAGSVRGLQLPGTCLHLGTTRLGQQLGFGAEGPASPASSIED